MKRVFFLLIFTCSIGLISCSPQREPLAHPGNINRLSRQSDLFLAATPTPLPQPTATQTAIQPPVNFEATVAAVQANAVYVGPTERVSDAEDLSIVSAETIQFTARRTMNLYRLPNTTSQLDGVLVENNSAEILEILSVNNGTWWKISCPADSANETCWVNAAEVVSQLRSKVANQ